MLGKVHGCDTMSRHFSVVNTILVYKNVGTEPYLIITQGNYVDKSHRADTGRELSALYKPRVTTELMFCDLYNVVPQCVL